MDSRNVSFPMTQVVFPFPPFSSARSFFCFPVRFLSAVVAVCFRNCCLLFRFNGRSRLRIALKISGKPDVYSRFSVDIFSVYSSRCTVKLFVCKQLSPQVDGKTGTRGVSTTGSEMERREEDVFE